MQLQVGDRLADESGEYEVIGRPYTTNMGKDVHVQLKRDVAGAGMKLAFTCLPDTLDKVGSRSSSRCRRRA
jgi:hypothetical protein